MKKFTVLATALTAVACLSFSSLSVAGPREQVKRIYERITGLQPGEATLLAMETQMGDGNSNQGVAVALSVMNGDYGNQAVEGFLGGTLKRMSAPWTNRDLDAFEPLNDYMALFIGVVHNDDDYREIMSGDIAYTHPSAPPYAQNSNAHYAAIENNGLPLSGLVRTTQSGLPGAVLAPADTAGLITTRAAAKAFFILGTNRAMLRFTLMSQLCHDLEQMEDPAGVPDRIRQDISRSPGGDSRLFLTGCVGCHIGMDPLAQAFAFYDYQHNPDGNPDTDDRDNGFLVFNATPQPNAELGISTRVTPKHHINANNFPHGYVTLDDGWDNYWRQGLNESFGWNYGNDQPSSLGQSTGSGNGPKSMGHELSNSYAFAQCQVQKVFKAVCLRDPATLVDGNGAVVDAVDVAQVAAMTDSFKNSGYQLKQVFAETANYCKGN